MQLTLGMLNTIMQCHWCHHQCSGASSQFALMLRALPPAAAMQPCHQSMHKDN